MLLAAVLAAILFLPANSSPEVEHRARTAEDPFNYGNPAFCEPKEPIEDFGLSKLPPVVEAPESGDLPFGPKTVSLELDAGPVLAPREGVGFRLHSENYGGHTPLQWVLRNRIRPVDELGQAGPVVAHSHMRVRTIGAGDGVETKLYLAPPRTPGFYLYEIEIVDFDGNLLAQYGRHIRVERKFWDARFGLNRKVFRSGNQVLSRVENFGTEPIRHGAAVSIQAYRERSWVAVRFRSPEIWPAWAGSAGPGSAGRCSSLQLPHDLRPGQYRILKEVERYVRPSQTQSYRLTAPFEVVD